VKKKTELRLAKKREIGRKQQAAREAHRRRDTIQESIDSANERCNMTQRDGVGSNFNLDSLEIVRE
jgi:hypothetical protein